jgi:hypothetical protein
VGGAQRGTVPVRDAGRAGFWRDTGEVVERLFIQIIPGESMLIVFLEMDSFALETMHFIAYLSISLLFS